MTTVHFSKEPSNWFKERKANLDKHDGVVEDTPPKEPAKQMDLSHLRPNKRIRGD